MVKRETFGGSISTSETFESVFALFYLHCFIWFEETCIRYGKRFDRLCGRYTVWMILCLPWSATEKTRTGCRSNSKKPSGWQRHHCIRQLRRSAVASTKNILPLVSSMDAVCIAKLAWSATVIIRSVPMNHTWSTTVVHALRGVEQQCMFA